MIPLSEQIQMLIESPVPMAIKQANGLNIAFTPRSLNMFTLTISRRYPKYPTMRDMRDIYQATDKAIEDAGLKFKERRTSKRVLTEDKKYYVVRVFYRYALATQGVLSL